MEVYIQLLLFFSASFTIARISYLPVTSFSYMYLHYVARKRGRIGVPEYNKYCLSIRSPPFSIKGTERSAKEKEPRAT